MLKPEHDMKKNILLLLILLTSAVLYSQEEVSGYVKDENGITLPGVSVYIKGTTIGTITDAEGKYNIYVEEKDAVLVFSFMGYLTKEIMVGDQTSVDVNMEPDLVDLEEVVVVGYGSQKKVSVVGAISTMTTED